MDKDKLIKDLTLMIKQTEQEKKDYLADGNDVDSYVMAKGGEVIGLKEAIKLIKTA
jgi:hypothetical protein